MRSLTDTVWLGSPVMLELELRGRAVERVVAGTPDLQYPSSARALHPGDPGRFVMRFEVLPQKPGKRTFGPYTLTVAGREVRSNRVEVQVLQAPEAASTLLLRVEPATITLGQTFKLYLTANDKRAHEAILKASGPYEIKTQSTSMNLSFTAGQKTEKNVRIYEIMPKRTGKLTLGRKDLEKLAPKIEVGTVTVQVR